MSKVFPSAFVQEQYPTEKCSQNPVKILTGLLQNLRYYFRKKLHVMLCGANMFVDF